MLFCLTHCTLYTVQYLLYHQRIYTEETAKVVAAVWGLN